jgi:hypothetical protein
MLRKRQDITTYIVFFVVSKKEKKSAALNILSISSILWRLRNGEVIDIHLFHFAFYFLWASRTMHDIHENAKHEKSLRRNRSSGEERNIFLTISIRTHRSNVFIGISYVVLEADYVNPPKKKKLLRNLSGERACMSREVLKSTATKASRDFFLSCVCWVTCSVDVLSMVVFNCWEMQSTNIKAAQVRSSCDPHETFGIGYHRLVHTAEKSTSKYQQLPVCGILHFALLLFHSFCYINIHCLVAGLGLCSVSLLFKYLHIYLLRWCVRASNTDIIERYMEREVGLGSLGYMFVDVSFFFLHFRTHIIFFLRFYAQLPWT